MDPITIIIVLMRKGETDHLKDKEERILFINHKGRPELIAEGYFKITFHDNMWRLIQEGEDHEKKKGMFESCGR